MQKRKKEWKDILHYAVFKESKSTLASLLVYLLGYFTKLDL